MKTMYEVQTLIQTGEIVWISTCKEKAYKFAKEHKPFTYVHTLEVNIFTYYFYKLIGR